MLMMKSINRPSLLRVTIFVTLISITQSLFSQYDVNEAPTEWKHQEMIVHNDRPWNIETPAHLLDDPFTSVEKMFVRNNGLAPTDLNAEEWTLTIENESVSNPKTYTLQELKRKFQHYT
ncbi:MAG: DMSO/TMAO reductase YedYZ molybdopterin-dependent catalytic subunit [Cryomorphaceae bacterium]|jgi:DMSO/TMAO reductase YedYZ molybdopterin-dependent catalytic subunit